MDAGTTWERLLHTPTTWIVVAAVLFVVAVVLLLAGARAGRRAARAQRDETRAAEVAAPGAVAAPDEDPVTEPAVPRRAPAVTTADAEEDPVTEPAAPRAGAPTPDAAVERLLGALVGDPRAALAGVAALERGEEPGRVAVTLLRSGVPAPAAATLCGVDADDLGGLVANALGVLPHEVPSAREQKVSL
ncbi:hypothetical protein [Actinomycetospora sp. TBRC 11914]|uniref:hypothetical protein n=1 Tax=Actinomycetospora sp. TBRC 11914 TaxID=2729387 RepID=UPI00145D4DAA|nr:hypothetical protein [Actinomycetospora sp. TBRC 11914]NMO93681.1 hypothetical protein [Actinomycetospora sp. TBRC 11914]